MSKRKISELDQTKQYKMLHDSIHSEDGTLKFDFMPSLKNIVMAKIVSHLWINPSIVKGITDLFHSDDGPGHGGNGLNFWERWYQFEKFIVTQVSQLPLPFCITQKLTIIIRPMGSSIFDWIRYHDEHILINSTCTNYSAVDFITNIFWTVRGKIDYAATAKKILSKEDGHLSVDQMYKFACTYCFEDEITRLAAIVVNQHYLDSVEFDIHPMVYFWTTRIINTKLSNPTYYERNDRDCTDENISKNERIFRLISKSDSLVKRTCNEVPVRYMWHILNEEEKSRNILSLIEKLSNHDLMYYLLSNLNYQTQQKVFQKCSNTILGSILNDWIMNDCFLSTTLRIMNVMDPSSYLWILREIITKMKNKTPRVREIIWKIQDKSPEEYKHVYNQYKSFLKTLWQKGSKQFKNFVFKHGNGDTLKKLVTESLSWEHDIDIIEQIFKDLTTQEKKSIALGYYGIELCTSFIVHNEWHLYEQFLKYTLSSEEDTSHLKQKLIDKKGCDIAFDFLDQEEALRKIEYFINWALKSQEEMDKFRENLAYEKCDADVQSMIYNNKIDFTKLEFFLNWGAKGDLEVINKIKTTVLESNQSSINALIEENRYESVEAALNWCLSFNQHEIEQFKRKWFKEYIDDQSLTKI